MLPARDHCGAGGDRGLYKTTDGGKTWQRILNISENTGVTDIAFDPRNPDVIYAASYQRRRNVGLLIGGGPEAAIFKTTDGGQNWKKLTNGIPDVDLGRIALAVSPQNPDVVYALIVAAGNESGFFRSADRGETWVRQSNYRVTDPQFYGEIYPDPHKFDRVYCVDVSMHRTDDGGKNVETLRWSIHVDNHALAFDPTDADHILVGNDGGVYETLDGGQTWRHFTNMSTIQFYRVGIDNALPFYNVHGGSQDNGSMGGPSRTINRVGIRTSDWISTGGGDGMQSRIDPEDANIVYSMSQNGSILRMDLRTSASTGIRPRADANGPRVRWNWDAPFIISPHSAARLYFAGSVLYRSDDRGNNWKAVSGDLTRQLDRDTIPVMGKIWEPNAVTKNLFTTDLGVGTALCESPIREGLLYVGTDDGLIQVSGDAGQKWTKIESFPGVPEMTYVSDILASQHNIDTVYAAFNNYQRGDFKPYLLKSSDRGKTWRSIAANLPNRLPVWSIAEDFVNRDLLFAGTEFGLFFTVNGGKEWIQLKGGVPTIAFRDLEIQKRETDLVCATFGYGFYILDDYTPLRQITSSTLSQEGAVFPLRKAYQYDEKSYVRAAFGNTSKPNPPFGAIFTYYLKGPFTADSNSSYVLTVAGADGKEIRRINLPARAGLGRINWDLRGQAPAGGGRGNMEFGVEEEEAELQSEAADQEAELLQQAAGNDQGQGRGGMRGGGARGGAGAARGGAGAGGIRGGRGGPAVKPGKFTVTLNKVVEGTTTTIGQPQTFEVFPLPQ